jgi:Flp pilus assembly pilin Flp
MLALHLYLSLSTLAHRVRRSERGQATAEYALVLLGAAAVALLVIGWATKTDLIGKLLDTVMNNVLGKVK